MKLIADLSSHSWSIEEQEKRYNQFYFSFVDASSQEVVFSDLKFGMSLSVNEEIIFEKSCPEEGQSFLSSDQEFLDVFVFNQVRFGETYSLYVWAENDGIRWESTFSFIPPVPEQPYPSWIYNEEGQFWFAPVPYPDDDSIYGKYEWNEQDQRWDEVNV